MENKVGFCGYCGTRLTEGQIFCPECGQKWERQKPKKKRRKLWIAAVALVLAFVLVSVSIVDAFVRPMFLYRLTGGVLKGAAGTLRLRELEPEELLAKEAVGVTEKEIQEYQSYVRRLRNIYESSLNKQAKKDVEFLDNTLLAIATNQLIRENGGSEENYIDVEAEGVRELLFSMGIEIEDGEENGFMQWLAPDRAYAAPYYDDKYKPSEGEVKTRYSELMYTCANSLYFYGHHSMSMVLASMAVMQDPLNVDVANLLADELRTIGAQEEALRILQYILRTEAGRGSEAVLYNMGMCCLEMGKTWPANTYFNDMLRINPESGPAYQGKMLVYAKEGDKYNTMIYMIEGARNGYTSAVTEVYQELRIDPDYEELAREVFAQYSMADLSRFTRTAQMFDTTLDTPGQQLKLSRNVVLPNTLSDALFSAGSLKSALSSWLKGAETEYGETFRQAMDGLKQLDSLLQNLQREEGSLDNWLGYLIKNQNFFSLPSGKQETKDVFELEINYEQEVFWFSILTDYVNLKLADYREDYVNKPMERLEKTSFHAVDEGLEAIEQKLEEDAAYLDSIIKDGKNPSLMDIYLALEYFMNFVHEAERNRAMMGDEATELGRALDKALSDANAVLLEGYKQTSMLLEEYWLYTNNILAYIGDCKNYNECRRIQRDTVMSAMFDYTLDMSMGYIGSVILLVSVSGFMIPVPQSGSSGCTLPDFPDMPITGMGNTITKFRFTFIEVKQEYKVEAVTNDEEGNETVVEGEENIQESFNPQGADPQTPGTSAQNPPAAAPPAQKPDYEESEIETNRHHKIYGGPFFTFEFGSDGFTLGCTFGSAGYNPKTGDLTIFIGAAPGIGYLNSGFDAMIGGEVVVNLGKGELKSSTVKAGFNAQVADSGMGAALGYNVVKMANETTLNASISGMRSSQTITER